MVAGHGGDRKSENIKADNVSLDSDLFTKPAKKKADAGVCAKFQTSRRREVVPFSHHAECSSIPDAEADQKPAELTP